MFEQIDRIVLHLHELETKIKESANKIRQERNCFGLEEGLIHNLFPITFNGGVGAVDSGLLAREVQGYDVVLTKTVGVNFVYNESKLVLANYYPSVSPTNKLHVQSSLNEHEILISRNLIRLNEEVKNAIELIERFKPEVVLIDGSLVPLPNDRPEEKSNLFDLYQELILNYKKLFATKSLIIGITKDSRSKRFVNSVGIDFANDTKLMNCLLNEDERSFAMSYSEKPTQITKDLENEIYCFYMRPLENDLPLRVEFLTKDFDKVASIVYSLSKISRSFAYPAALIEADLRAALNPLEMERFDRLNLTPLRRNNRPFR